ncbi:Bifunctional (p)ppGpp synthase/hydrolase relA [compost metagenome]
MNGDAGMLLNLAKCCAPVPGETIMGTVTRGRGLSVHASDCPNLLAVEPERRLAVEWGSHSSQASYPVEVAVEVIDRVGILKDITIKIADTKTNIRTVKVRPAKDKIVVITLILEVVDMAHLNRVLATIGRISDVIKAYRVARSPRRGKKS